MKIREQFLGKASDAVSSVAYAVGVLLSFAISQLGMFVKAAKGKQKKWIYGSFINLIGDIITPLESYISEREAGLKKHQNLTVVLTKFVGSSWKNKLFHNQTSFFIARKLGGHQNVVTVLVPYLYKD